MCGNPGKFLGINSKKYRCVYTITQCPGFISKTKAVRHVDVNHMKDMNQKAQQRLSQLIEDEGWRQSKSQSISDAISKRGGHAGVNNPRYGQLVTEETRQKMSTKAKASTHSRGQYERTVDHRDRLSQHMIDVNTSGRNKRTRDTKPEKLFESLLMSNNITYQKQFLIQFGSIKAGKRFRHCYDFYLPTANLLVEIDGDYWHSLPESIQRDKLCEDIAEQKGFQIIRFKQSYLETNYKECVSVIVQRCNATQLH